MITIKFQKKPNTPQRQLALKIAKDNGINISQDDFYYTLSPENIDQAYKIIEEAFNGYSSGLHIEILNKELKSHYVTDLYECIKNKKPYTNLSWFDNQFSGFLFCKDFKEFADKINNLGAYEGEMLETQLDSLSDNFFIETIKYHSEYKIDKDKLKEEIINQSRIIKHINPTFSEKEVLKIIDSLPENINLEEKETIEGVDYISKFSFMKEVLELLRKIEKNTSK